LDETRHCLRFLNWFILTILREKEDVLLFKMLGYESVMTDLLVQMFNSVQIDFNSPDLNFSYSSTGEALLLSFSLLKTWVLLKLRTGTSQNEELKKLKVLNPISFWMSVWPALRRLLDMIEPTSLFLVIEDVNYI
jgi:hypothetical protein